MMLGVTLRKISTPSSGSRLIGPNPDDYEMKMSFRSTLVAMLPLPLRTALKRMLGRGATKPAAGVHRAIVGAFCCSDAGAVTARLEEQFGPIRLRVAFDANLPIHPMSCIWAHRPGEGSCFTFRQFEAGHLVDVVVDRWLSMFPLFLQAERQGWREGCVTFNFNDSAVDPGLAFCGNAPGHLLLPDFLFIRSLGYAEQRAHFARETLTWHDRSPRVFWRGSSLGQDGLDILDMPRAKLCRIARDAYGDLFNVGFSELLDVSDEDADRLRRESFVKDYVPWQHLGLNKFHIDIDGHAASYAGLFSKLLSGGLVIKVGSRHDYAQWYYERLKPWVNFVPVSPDLADLEDVVSHCRRHDDASRAIARCGQELALSMTFDDEFPLAIERVARVFGDSRLACWRARRCGRCGV